MASSRTIVFVSILLVTVAPALAGLRGVSMADMISGGAKSGAGLRGGGIGMADLLAASGDNLVEPTNDDLLSDSDTPTVEPVVPGPWLMDFTAVTDMSPEVPGSRTSKSLEGFIMASRSRKSTQKVLEGSKIRLGDAADAGQSKEAPAERIGSLKIRGQSKEAPAERIGSLKIRLGSEPSTGQSKAEESTKRSRGFRLRPSVDELWNFGASEKENQWKKETESTWSLVDADSNGVVSMKELQAKLWTDHGPYATMMQVQRFRAADANKDGLLQYNEFHEFLHVVDAPGLLYHEFRRLEKAAGMEVADEEAAEEEFHLHDSNGDGLLSHQEFEKLMAGHQLFKPRAKPRRLIASVDSRGERAFTMDHMPKALQKLLSSTSSEEFFAHPAAHGRFGGEL